MDEGRVSEFKATLVEAVSEVGRVRIKVGEEMVREFYELVGERGEVNEGDDVSPAFITAYYSLYLREVILKAVSRVFPSLVRAMIHAESKLDVYEPLCVGETYTVEMDIGNVGVKRGRKGVYYVLKSPLRIIDSEGRIVAQDERVVLFKAG